MNNSDGQINMVQFEGKFNFFASRRTLKLLEVKCNPTN